MTVGDASGARPRTPPPRVAVIPWEVIDRAQVPGDGGELTLHRRGEEYSIRADGEELMNSRLYGSEEMLAELACDRISERRGATVLVGGLGLGFTTAAALRKPAPDARVLVAELVPAVVAWNRGPLAHLAGYPLGDPRVFVHEGDVGRLLRAARAKYDAVLLDVDNGPKAFTRPCNNQLYSRARLAATRLALRPRGVLAVWSAAPDRAFAQRLTRRGFWVEEVTVRARHRGGGPHHTYGWLKRPARTVPFIKVDFRHECPTSADHCLIGGFRDACSETLPGGGHF